MTNRLHSATPLLDMITDAPLVDRITIIIPAFNSADHIARALDSGAAQGDVVEQIIVVDDGSTDRTADRVREWERSTGRPVILVQQPNAGASAARNAGLAHATGTYVQFLDADDELLPGKLVHQLKLAEARGWPELVIGRGREVDPAGHTLRIIGVQGPSSDPWLDLMEHRMSITSCNLWKRQAVIDAGGWNTLLRSSQEYDLMFRMLQRDVRVVHDERILTMITKRGPGSISGSNIRANRLRYTELRVRILEYLIELNDGRDLGPYHQVVYDNLRVLYALDPNAAKALYDRHIPASFKPRRTQTTGIAAWLLHRTLGFHQAERARRFLKGAG